MNKAQNSCCQQLQLIFLYEPWALRELPSSKLYCGTAEKLSSVCSFLWSVSGLWNLQEYSLYFWQGISPCHQIPFPWTFWALVSYGKPRRKSVRKQDREWDARDKEIDYLNVTKKQVSNCWPNVKLLEQFGCLVYLNASYPGLTKPRIYQQTAEDNFQQHCAQSKGRDSNELIKPFEPECLTDFILSHRLCLLCSPACLTSVSFW